MKKNAVFVPVLVLLLTAFAWSANTLPATIEVPVTFYDFHSNGSNPEFEKTPTPVSGGLQLGMVASKLNANSKPVLGPTPYWNCDIARWFVPYQKGDSTIPNYTTPATTGCGNPRTKMTNDTAFINRVFHDTLVFQKDAQGTYTFIDTAFFPLDGRGFGNEGRSNNFSFSMEMHWEFSYAPGLTFRFQGDDDVWAFIDDSLVMDLGGIHGATAGSFSIDNLNIDKKRVKHKLDFFYCERHVTKSTIQITTNLIKPRPDTLFLTSQPANGIIPAGDSVKLFATVKDDTGGVRPDYSAIVSWELHLAKSGSKNIIDTTKGALNKFYGITAYETDTIIATFIDPEDPTRILHGRIPVTVVPGPARKIVIEVDTLVPPDLWDKKPNPLPFIAMDSSINYDTVFAITYDKYDNYTGRADSAAWSTMNSGLVTVSAIAARLFAGIIHRETRELGSTSIIATQGALIPDSLQVNLQTGNIIAIQLVDYSNDKIIIDSIHINTDQQKNVKIQVQWSNAPGVWVDGIGSWELKPDTVKWDAPQPPLPGSQAGSWNLNPITPGKFNLTVRAGTRLKTVPVIIDPAPPSKVKITLLTAADSLIAGKYIKYLVQIENTDGLVPGNWCVVSSYHDSIDNSKRPAYTPSIVVSSSTVSGLDVKTRECFVNGKDTVTSLLYYAPYAPKDDKLPTDSLHLISVTLSGDSVVGSPFAAIERFRLLPGPLDSISLEDATMKPMPGPDTVYFGNDLIVYSSGFDDFGNRIGQIDSRWQTNGGLHAIDTMIKIFRIIYSAGSNDGTGYISATAPSEVRIGITLKDSLQVVNIGSNATIDSAVTRDTSGNGYLDQIVVYYNKSVSVPANYNSANAKVFYVISSSKPDTFKFSVTSVTALTGSSSIVTVRLRDTVKLKNGLAWENPAPQTNWLPRISISGLTGANPISNLPCKDYAGPVIWRVQVERKSFDNFTTDSVTVTFSESIKNGLTGDNFPSNTFPTSAFNVFRRAKTGTDTFYVPDTFKLSGIPKFDPLPSDAKRLTFKMSNGLELMDYNYFNISNKRLISDAANQGLSNLPVEDNQKIRVEITGVHGDFIAGPNPAIPTFHNVPAGQFYFKNEPQAYDWAKRGEGTDLRIQLRQGLGKVTGHISIYDVVGNLVAQTSNDNNLLTERSSDIGTSSDSSLFNYDVYWNCTNSKGMKVAPGGYLVILYLTSTNPNGVVTKDRKPLMLGIKR